MAAAEHPLARALSGLGACLGRAPAVPRTLAGCTELLQALVTWAAPNADPGDEEQVPARAVAALRASLLLLEAVRAESRDGQLTSAGAAKAERVPKAEKSGKSGGSSLLLAGDVAPEGGAPTPDVPISRDQGGLEAPGKRGGPPASADVALGNSAGAVIFTRNGDVTPDSPEVQDGAPNPVVGCDSEPTSDDSSGVIDPECVLQCAAAPLLLLCGAHIQDTPWSSAQSRQLARQLLRALLQGSCCASVANLLRGDLVHPFSTYKEALRLLGPRLHKDTWESHPDAKLVFSWLLLQVPRPGLAEFLSRVMPPSLLFSDDYKPENKVLGIRCLQHIIKNVPAADLRQYNRAMVVYHALRNHLYSNDAEIIEVVLPCLLDLFPVIKKPPPTVGAYEKDGENPCDQVMQLVLAHMEMEHKVGLRRLYARNLPALQERLGVRIVRHMKRLLQVIVGYLEVEDGPEETARLSILETLQGTIRYAWPRIPSRLPLLLKTLLKLIYEISSESNQNSVPVTKALLDGATECLLLLDRCSKGQVKTALKGIPSVCNEPLLVKCIDRVLQDA